MAERRRVLWVMKGLGRGGAERLTTSCAREIDHGRFSVEVAYVLPWKDAFVPELERDGVTVHCLGRGRARAGWVPRLRQLLRSERYDIVHTHSPVPAVATRVLASSGTRVIHTEHNVWGRYRLPTYAANAVTFGRNDHVLAVSDGVRTSIERPRWAPWLTLPTIETLHHGMDLETARFGPEARAAARRRLHLPLDTPVLGTVANFTPKKDQASLLAALASLVQRHPGLQLVMVGSGPLQGELERRVKALGLGHHVRFAGMRDDVQDILPAFDLFVLSSLHEGLSIALVEAMASEVTPVSTAVGGVPELIEHGRNGLLVPKQDPGAFAAAVEKLLDDPDERARLAANARERAQHFGIGPAARRMESLYASVLA